MKNHDYSHACTSDDLELRFETDLYPLVTFATQPPIKKPDRPGTKLYRDLVVVLRDRRVALGLAQDDFNDTMGLADGYTNKLESRARFATWATLILWTESLGLQISLVPGALPQKTLEIIERNSNGVPND